MGKTLVHIHDPMCSWCWGFRPAWEQVLQGLLPAQETGKLQVIYRVGGLAPDSDAPMPQDMQQMLSQTWCNIQNAIPGTPFNFDFWQVGQPRRSTYPACRAVLAAKQLNPAAETTMIKAIQQAYYLQAQNPSDNSTLISIAKAIGLDQKAFAAALVAEDIEQTLQQHIAQARYLFQYMCSRGFPSLALIDGDTINATLSAQQITTIDIDYNNPETILGQIMDNL